MADVATRILATLPAVIDIESVTKMYPTSYTESMNTVLVQEAIRYNRLVLSMALYGPVTETTAVDCLCASRRR